MKTEIKPIPLYYDLPFKNLFGTQKNIRFTMDLLESLLELNPGSLKGSKIKNSVKLDCDTIKNKKFELDILVELPNGDKINIEMQKQYSKDAEIKNYMYVCGVFSNQLIAGNKYLNYTKSVLQVNFVKNNDLHKDDSIIKRYCMVNLNNPNDLLLGNLFNIIIVDVDRKNNFDYNKNRRFELWRKLIAAETLEEMEKIAHGEPLLEEAVQEMKRFWGSKEVQDYSIQEKLIQSQLANLKEEGKEIGLEEGKEIGIAEGSIESKKEIAKNLFAMGMKIEDVAQATGLSIKELETLK